MYKKILQLSALFLFFPVFVHGQEPKYESLSKTCGFSEKFKFDINYSTQTVEEIKAARCMILGEKPPNIQTVVDQTLTEKLKKIQKESGINESGEIDIATKIKLNEVMDLLVTAENSLLELENSYQKLKSEIPELNQSFKELCSNGYYSYPTLKFTKPYKELFESKKRFQAGQNVVFKWENCNITPRTKLSYKIFNGALYNEDLIKKGALKQNNSFTYKIPKNAKKDDLLTFAIYNKDNEMLGSLLVKVK